MQKLRIVTLIGWEIAHAAVSRRPPISLCAIVAGTHTYTHAAKVRDLPIVQGPVSVALCQPCRSASAAARPRSASAAAAAAGVRLASQPVPSRLYARCVAQMHPASATDRGACLTAVHTLRIVTLGFGTRRDREWSLNDGQIPNPNVARVPLVRGYHRVEGNQRASRNGPTFHNWQAARRTAESWALRPAARSGGWRPSSRSRVSAAARHPPRRRGSPPPPRPPALTAPPRSWTSSGVRRHAPPLPPRPSGVAREGASEAGVVCVSGLLCELSFGERYTASRL
jgi:hypothetical protein